MSNILLAYQNRIDSATLTQGSYSASMPRDNLKHSNVSKFARTSNAAIGSTRVLADLGALYTLRAAALVNHNLSTSAKWRLRAGASPLDLDFTTDAPDSRLTYSGGTNGTVVNSAGTIGTADTTPRIDFDPASPDPLAAKGLLIELAATNLLLNSATLSTQGVTVTAVAHTLSFFGTGTVTLSGASTAGPLVGTGATVKSKLTFTPSAGVLTLTVTGSVTFAQLETGSVATSWISTAGAAVTRTTDSVTLTGASFTAAHSATAGTLYAEFATPADGSARPIISVDDGTANNHILIYVTATSLKFRVTTGGVAQCDITIGTVAANTFYKVAAAWSANDFAACMNGGTVQTDGSGSVPTVDRMRLGSDQPGNIQNGHQKRVVRWTTRLTNAQLQSITTSGPGAVDYDTGWINAQQLTFSGDTPANWGAQYNVIKAFDAISARYLTVEVSDTANSDGYVEIGRLFVGGGFQPAINAEQGSLKHGREDLSTVVRSQSGKRFYTRQTPLPRWVQFVMPGLTTAEGDQLHEMEAAVGITEEVLYVTDPADMAKSQRYGFLGQMRELSPMEYPLMDVASRAFQIDEKL